MGAAAARKLAADGYRVAILSPSGKGEALAEELGGIGVTGSNQSEELCLTRRLSLTPETDRRQTKRASNDFTYANPT
ncbi:hypothetical protein D3C80_1612440 [compost metagenome]